MIDSNDFDVCDVMGAYPSLRAEAQEYSTPNH